MLYGNLVKMKKHLLLYQMELFKMAMQFILVQFKNIIVVIIVAHLISFHLRFYYVLKVCLIKKFRTKKKAFFLFLLDRLAALWPFIGIVVVVLVLVIIILIFEKRQKSNKKSTTTDDDEQDRASDP